MQLFQPGSGRGGVFHDRYSFKMPLSEGAYFFMFAFSGAYESLTISHTEDSIYNTEKNTGYI